MVAGGLCATAVIVFVWSDKTLERDTANRGDTATRRSNSRPINRSNDIIQVSDPVRALTHAFTLGDRNERESRIRDLLSAWAIQDAEAALDWVASLEDSAARRSARSTVCFALAEKDPRQAVTLALAHGADEDDDRGLLECLTMQWCEKECKSVVDWASEQPTGEWRERLLASASFVLSKSDPAAAAHIVSGLESGTVQNEAAMAVLHQWALQDSSAALQWAEAFPESMLRERALTEIANLRNLADSLHTVE
jgi:hypothetical protein